MSRPSTAAVRLAGLDDAATVGDVLSAAFADTPLGRLLPVDHNTRKRLLRHVFTDLAGWAAEHGTVHLRGDGAGAAIWLPADGTRRRDTVLTDDLTHGAAQRQSQ